MSDTRFKIDKGLWVIKESGSTANTSIDTDVNVSGNVNITGSAFYVSGNFTVGGSLVYANTTIAGDLVPVNTGANLGNTTNRFVGWYSNTNINGYLNPSANGVNLGNTVARWLAYSTNIDATGTLNVVGNTTLGSSVLTIDTTNKRISVNTATTSAALEVAGISNFTGNVGVTGVVTTTGNTVAGALVLATGAVFSNNSGAVSFNSGVATKVDSYPKSIGNASKVFMLASNTGLAFHATEMLIIHDGTNILSTRYADLFNTSLGSFDAIINNANVDITFTSSSTQTITVKTIRQQML